MALTRRCGHSLCLSVLGGWHTRHLGSGLSCTYHFENKLKSEIRTGRDYCREIILVARVYDLNQVIIREMYWQVHWTSKMETEPTARRPLWSSCRSLLQRGPAMWARSQETGPHPSGDGGWGAQEWLPPGGVRAPCEDITDSVVMLQWPEPVWTRGSYPPNPPMCQEPAHSAVSTQSVLLLGKTDTPSKTPARFWLWPLRLTSS